MDVDRRYTRSWLWFCGLLLLAGCITGTPSSRVVTSSVPIPPPVVPVATGSGDVVAASPGMDPTDVARLAEVWHQRQAEVLDYPIGPGDVIEIAVPMMKELESRTIRVSGKGTISLPFLGILQVKSLTEDELTEQLRQRLSKYMFNPQVNVFVREYRSRQAAVIGAVQKPGLYSLASGADSILDLVAQAGGLNPGAAQRVLFIPAQPIAGDDAKKLATLLPMQVVSTAATPLFLKKVDPIVIDLQSLSTGTGQIYLTIPARPGDVILVPGAGDVLVDGWVERPGSYKITPGLTVLGAVTAAGGPLFAADTNTVKIHRTDGTGARTVLVADLGKIKSGEQEDVRVQESDVVDVASSTIKMIPYGLSRFFTTIFRVGGSIPVF